jgi:hypothetical protein
MPLLPLLLLLLLLLSAAPRACEAALAGDSATEPAHGLAPLLEALTLSAWVFPGTRPGARVCFDVGAATAMHARVCVNASTVTTSVAWGGAAAHYSSAWVFGTGGTAPAPAWHHVGLLLPTLCAAGSPGAERVLVNGSDATRATYSQHGCTAPAFVNVPYVSSDAAVTFTHGTECVDAGTHCLAPRVGTLTLWLAYHAYLCLSYSAPETVCAHPVAMWAAVARTPPTIAGLPPTCGAPPFGAAALQPCYGSTATDGAWAWGSGAALAPAGAPALPPPDGVADNSLCTEHAVDCAGVFLGDAQLYDLAVACDERAPPSGELCCGDPAAANCTGVAPYQPPAPGGGAGTNVHGGATAAAPAPATLSGALLGGVITAGAVLCGGVVLAVLVAAVCVVTNRCDRAVIVGGGGTGRRSSRAWRWRAGRRPAAVDGETWVLVGGSGGGDSGATARGSGAAAAAAAAAAVNEQAYDTSFQSVELQAAATASPEVRLHSHMMGGDGDGLGTFGGVDEEEAEAAEEDFAAVAVTAPPLATYDDGAGAAGFGGMDTLDTLGMGMNTSPPPV